MKLRVISSFFYTCTLYNSKRFQEFYDRQMRLVCFAFMILFVLCFVKTAKAVLVSLDSENS